MNKKEILEIKKQMTMQNCCITKIATCYVNHEKEILLNQIHPFLSLPEEEAYKYMDIFKKSLSGTKGKNLYEIPVVEVEKENFFYHLKSSKLEDKKMLQIFFDTIVESYEFGENYLIVLIHGLYDIPGKTTDDMLLDDASNEVYEHILCCICPVGLSKPGLSVNQTEQKIKDRIRDWVVDMPVDAFLYPAFTDRSSDIHSLLYYSKKKQLNQSELVYRLTGVTNKILSTDEEREMLAKVMKDNSEIDFEQFNNLSREVKELLEVNENTTISQNELSRLMEECGMEDSVLIQQSCESLLGEDYEVHLESLVEKGKTTIKTGNATVKLDADFTHEVKTQKIDGRVYLMIPLNENVLEYNGFNVKGK